MKKYKICLFLSANPHGGGTFQHTLNFVSALDFLDKQKFEVTYLTIHDGWGEHFPHSSNHRCKSLSKITQYFDKILNIIIGNGELNRNITKLLHPIPRYLNNEKYDLIIFPSQDRFSYMVNCRSIVSVLDLMHRYEPNFKEYRGRNFTWRENHYKFISQFSDVILVDSQLGKIHQINSYQTNPEKIHVLEYPAPKYFHKCSLTNVTSSLKNEYFLYPAQFWEHKNHLRLIKAFNKIASITQVDLVLSGAKENNYKSINHLISRLDLANRIHIVGYVSNDDIYTLYKNSLALIYPSLLGPTNIPPLEAMLLGCPVLCSNVYAMKEQLGDAAAYFDPYDIDSIADKMLEIISNNELRTNLINKGKELMIKKSFEVFSVKLNSIVSSVLIKN